MARFVLAYISASGRLVKGSTGKIYWPLVNMLVRITLLSRKSSKTSTMGHFLFPTLCEFGFNKVWVFGGSQWVFSHSSSQRWWIIKPGTVKHYQDIHHWTPRWIWANFQFYNRTEQFSPSVLQFYFGQWTHLMRALTQDDNEALIVQEKPQSKAHDNDPRELQQKHTETQVSQTKQYPDMKQTCVSTMA